MIYFKSVCKRYVRGKSVVNALSDVTFEIPQGAIAIVRGHSGSGKTTLINIAAGLMRPTSGSVIIDGERIEQFTPARSAALRARRVAVVFQMFHLVPYLSALDNVLLPTLAVPGDPKQADARARELLMTLGLADRMNHYPDELSAGERQRCALARALLNKPDVVLADEPTGNLDPHSAKAVMRALAQHRAEGATVLLVTHHPVEGIEPDIELRLSDGRLETGAGAAV